MTESRPRHRARGQFFATPDLLDLLFAFGDNPYPDHSLSLTVSTLSEILEDFITETCHAAALSASYSRRQKIKVDDFKWVLREDPVLLGRALEQLWKDRGLKEERRMMDVEKVGGAGVEELGALAEMGGVAGEVRKKGRGRGGGRKRKLEGEGEKEAKRVREE